ncbi:hypothetical protein C8Q72DRAFT_615851, partial [Fomitopsis betulina]
ASHTDTETSKPELQLSRRPPYLLSHFSVRGTSYHFWKGPSYPLLHSHSKPRPPRLARQTRCKLSQGIYANAQPDQQPPPAIQCHLRYPSRCVQAHPRISDLGGHEYIPQQREGQMPTLPKGWDNPPAREAIALQGSREREGQWGKPFAWKPREHSPQLQACVRPPPQAGAGDPSVRAVVATDQTPAVGASRIGAGVPSLFERRAKALAGSMMCV